MKWSRHNRPVLFSRRTRGATQRSSRHGLSALLRKSAIIDISPKHVQKTAKVVHGRHSIFRNMKSGQEART